MLDTQKSTVVNVITFINSESYVMKGLVKKYKRSLRLNIYFNYIHRT